MDPVIPWQTPLAKVRHRHSDIVVGQVRPQTPTRKEPREMQTSGETLNLVFLVSIPSPILDNLRGAQDLALRFRNRVVTFETVPRNGKLDSRPTPPKHCQQQELRMTCTVILFSFPAMGGSC